MLIKKYLRLILIIQLETQFLQKKLLLKLKIKYLVVLVQLSKLISIQKLQILKKKFLILIVQLKKLILMQNLQKLKIKDLIILVLLQRLILVQRLQRLKIKHTILGVCLIDRYYFNYDGRQNFCDFHQSYKSVRLCQPNNVKVIAWKPIKKIKPPVRNLPSEIKYFNGGKIFLKLSNNV